MKKHIFFATILISTACSHREMICMEDPRYFVEPPVIVVKNERAFIQYEYSKSLGQPNFTSYSVIRRDSLFVGIKKTPGASAGAQHNDEITKMTHLALVNTGRVFWECNGTIKTIKIDSVRSE